jgi:hypothetical protein
MNGWTAFALGIVVGASFCAFVLGLFMLGTRMDRARELEIATAMKELDDKKAQKE